MRKWENVEPPRDVVRTPQHHFHNASIESCNNSPPAGISSTSPLMAICCRLLAVAFTMNTSRWRHQSPGFPNPKRAQQGRLSQHSWSFIARYFNDNTSTQQLFPKCVPFIRTRVDACAGRLVTALQTARTRAKGHGGVNDWHHEQDATDQRYLPSNEEGWGGISFAVGLCAFLSGVTCRRLGTFCTVQPTPSFGGVERNQRAFPSSLLTADSVLYQPKVHVFFKIENVQRNDLERAPVSWLRRRASRARCPGKVRFESSTCFHNSRSRNGAQFDETVKGSRSRWLLFLSLETCPAGKDDLMHRQAYSPRGGSWGNTLTKKFTPRFPGVCPTDDASRKIKQDKSNLAADQLFLLLTATRVPLTSNSRVSVFGTQVLASKLFSPACPVSFWFLW